MVIHEKICKIILFSISFQYCKAVGWQFCNSALINTYSATLHYYLNNSIIPDALTKLLSVYKLLVKMLNNGNNLISVFNMQASYQAFSCMVLNSPCWSFPYSDVIWASWQLKLLAIRLVFQQLVWFYDKDRSRLLITQAFGGSPSVTGETRHLSFIPSQKYTISFCTGPCDIASRHQ